MNKWNKLWLAIILLTGNIAAFAQQKIQNISDQQELVRSGGKIYVVGAVVMTILAALIVYVIRIDRKLSRLEKKNV